MIGIIGIMGCVSAAVMAAVAIATTVATVTTQCVLADKQEKAAAEAAEKAEKRQNQSQQAQTSIDRRRANAARQAAARGILLARIDSRQTVHETNKLNRKLASKTGKSRPMSRVSRGSYHNGSPAQ